MRGSNKQKRSRHLHARMRAVIIFTLSLQKTDASGTGWLTTAVPIEALEA
jgi:hypothetical protein